MASALMHIAVAKEINKVLKMDEEMLVGAIAPDLGKLIGQKKEIAHYQVDAQSLPDLDKFLKKHELNTPYNVGYYIHLLTDKIWFSEYFPRHYNDKEIRLATGKFVEMDHNEKVALVYEDYSSLNKLMVDRFKLDLKFLNKDYNIETDITEIPVEDLHILFDNVNKILKLNQIKPLNVFREDEVLEFISKCVEEGLYAISKQKEQA